MQPYRIPKREIVARLWPGVPGYICSPFLQHANFSISVSEFCFKLPLRNFLYFLVQVMHRSIWVATNAGDTLEVSMDY